VGRHVVCPASELPPGKRTIVDVGGRSIGVFNVKGSYYALRNRCPHRGAPLCKGEVKDLITGSKPYEYVVEREGEILRCPWHGWEFDIVNGQSYFNPHRVRVRSYDVTVERLPGATGPEQTRTIGADEPDPTVETYAVTVEQEMIVLHV
jgi:nitrite reductase/ring-hydroxylating ferredoxin subunit